MNKLSYILIGLILFLLIAISVTWYIQGREIDNSEYINPVATYTDFSISLPNKLGTDVVIDNFLKSPSVTPDVNNPGLFFLGNTFALDPKNNKLPPYVIVYEKDTGFFNIALLQKPLALSRQEAEKYLIGLLQIDETTMCGISYTLSVPGYVDEAASGIDYRFSFCPESLSL